MKKPLKLILVVLIICIGFFLGNLILNQTYHTKFESLDTTDQRMLQELSTIYKNFETSSNNLWDETYHFETKPIILIRSNKDGGIIRKEAYALNVKNMEDSIFAKEIKIPKSLQLPKVYRVSRFDFKTFSAWMPINFGKVSMNNDDVFYFKYHPKMLNNPDLYFDFPSFMLHEAFHTYKQKDWVYDIKEKGGGTTHIENYPKTAENYALMGLEFKLLDQAMLENIPETIKQYLYDWSLLRKYRYEKWPQLKEETNTEAIEGTARYLEYRYSKLSGGKLTVLAKKEEPYHVTFTEAFDFIANGQAESATFLERSMQYETGAALGLLMDKAKIPWKTEIEDTSTKRGKTQYKILNQYFKIDSIVDLAKKVKEIEANYDYDTIEKQAKKLAKEIIVENIK